jgi:transglutaminase-like putative cysteine protease
MGQGGSKIPQNYLAPTYFIESRNPTIIEKVSEITRDISSADNVEKIKRIFYFVRDEILYKARSDRDYISRQNTRASVVLERGDGYCIQKSILFVAMVRSIGIPARLHFVDIINYMTPENFKQKLGSNLFIFHGYGEVYLNEKWLEANIAFDRELCQRKGYPTNEFDGIHPSLFAHFNDSGDKFVDYIKDRGTYADMPYRKIMWTWLVEYVLKGKIKKWRKKKGYLEEN